MRGIGKQKYPDQVDDFRPVRYNQVSLDAELTCRSIDKVDDLNLEGEGAVLEVFQVLLLIIFSQ